MFTTRGKIYNYYNIKYTTLDILCTQDIKIIYSYDWFCVAVKRENYTK